MGVIKSLESERLETEEETGPDIDHPENEVPTELLAAEARCPQVAFVKSCRAFFNKRGFLSEKQRNALRYAATPHRRTRYWNGMDPIY